MIYSAGNFVCESRAGQLFVESDLPIKVDVVDWATASATFRKIIE